MGNKKYLADYHMHSSFSNDSKCEMEDMVKHAILIGLDEIAFTDHVDYGVKTVNNCEYEEYFKELDRVRKIYGAQIDIKTGIEFGVQEHTIDQFNKDLEEYSFDFIILSNHQIDNKEFWNHEFQEGKTQDQYQKAYYKAILDVVKIYKNYSVLGHLDMIRRYDKCGEYPADIVLEQVEPILKQVIEDGKGIEVNTSSFKYGLSDLMPSRKILEKYYELGGRILTIGSDTHDTRHMGDHFEEVKIELREIGFTQYCTFNKMQPIFHEL